MASASRGASIHGYERSYKSDRTSMTVTSKQQKPGTDTMRAKSMLPAALAAVLLSAQAPRPAHAQAGPPRFAQPKMEELNADQQDAANGVLRQSSSGLGGPYGMLLKSPELLRRYLMMTDYLRQKTSLPKHLNEMAILMEARIWDAQYEWWAHEPPARKAGLSDAIIADIRGGRRPAAMKPDEAVVYDVVTQLLTSARCPTSCSPMPRTLWESSNWSISLRSPGST